MPRCFEHALPDAHSRPDRVETGAARRTRTALAWLVLAGCLLPLAGGCNIIGALAQVVPQADLPARYEGLKGQTVAVMVWADRATMMDYPNIRLDIATAVQAQLMNGNHKDLLGARFFPPNSVIRYEDSNPDLEGMPLAEIAPRLRVSRVIRIEVQQLDTRAPLSVDLFKGTILANLEVAEVTNPGSTTAPSVATIVYRESDIRSVWPKKSPDGTKDSTPYDIYKGTIGQFAEDLGTRFYSHPKPEDEGQ